MIGQFNVVFYAASPTDCIDSKKEFDYMCYQYNYMYKWVQKVRYFPAIGTKFSARIVSYKWIPLSSKWKKWATGLYVATDPLQLYTPGNGNVCDASGHDCFDSKAKDHRKSIKIRCYWAPEHLYTKCHEFVAIYQCNTSPTFTRSLCDFYDEIPDCPHD